MLSCKFLCRLLVNWFSNLAAYLNYTCKAFKQTLIYHGSPRESNSIGLRWSQALLFFKLPRWLQCAARDVGLSEEAHHIVPLSVFAQNVCMSVSLQLFSFSPVIVISEVLKICFFYFLFCFCFFIFHWLSKKVSFQAYIFDLYSYLILPSFNVSEREYSMIMNYTFVCSSQCSY